MVEFVTFYEIINSSASYMREKGYIVKHDADITACKITGIAYNYKHHVRLNRITKT